VATKAAQALGHICFGLLPERQAAAAEAAAAAGGAGQAQGAPERLAAARQALVKRLLALSSHKAEEVQFALGEAVAFGFGGVPIGPETILGADFSSLSDSFAIFKAEVDGGEQPMLVGGRRWRLGRCQQLLPLLLLLPLSVLWPPRRPQRGAQRADCTPLPCRPPQVDGAPPAAAAEPDAVQRLVLAAVLDELVPHVRPEHRAAGCVWLVSLLTYCRRHPVLLARLTQLQVGAGSVLGGSQTAPCRGRCTLPAP
jgi:hypothetical protein